MIRLYAALAGLLALFAGGWYVAHVIEDRKALQSELRAANDKLSQAHAHIRQRIDAERQQRATDAESARLAARARDAVPAVSRRLREYVTVPVPADTTGDADSNRDCKASESVARVDAGRLAAVETACAQVDADRAILAAEVLRLERELSHAPAQ